MSSCFIRTPNFDNIFCHIAPLKYRINRNKLTRECCIFMFNPIQDGLFRGCLRMGRGGRDKKAPLPYNLSHISYNEETWHNFIFFWVLQTSAFLSNVTCVAFHIFHPPKNDTDNVVSLGNSPDAGATRLGNR